ncbi:MAG: phage protein Gp37 [Thermodesulfobacteriota bacterium]
MASFSWTAVEDAMLAALEARVGPLVHTLRTYQGDWLEDLRRQGWRLPAVLLLLERSRAEQVSARSFDVTLDFRLLVVVRQLRGEEAGRREEGGVYQILGEIREALWNQDLGLNILPLALIQEEPLLNTQEFTVYAADYRTGAVQEV